MNTTEKRIEYKASCTWRKQRKTVGVLEIRIPDYGHKYVDITEFKERSGVQKISQKRKIEEWLNTDEGKRWALETPHQRVF